MVDRLFFGACFGAILFGWLIVALLVWMVLYHLLALLLVLCLLAVFAVHRRRRSRDTLTGPWQ